MKKRKINTIDLGVIIVLILLVVAIVFKYKKFNADDGGVTSKIDKIIYEMSFTGVRDYTTDAFESGDTVYDSQTNVAIGKITEKNIETSKEYKFMENGTAVKTEVPGKYDLKLKIETEGMINTSGYYANKTVELKVGSEKTIETKYVKSTGRIASIESGSQNK